MARPYEEVVDTSYMLKDPGLKKFAEALTEIVRKENEELNTLFANKRWKRFFNRGQKS